jgi:hypothetical protein
MAEQFLTRAETGLAETVLLYTHGNLRRCLFLGIIWARQSNSCCGT